MNATTYNITADFTLVFTDASGKLKHARYNKRLPHEVQKAGEAKGFTFSKTSVEAGLPNSAWMVLRNWDANKFKADQPLWHKSEQAVIQEPEVAPEAQTEPHWLNTITVAELRKLASEHKVTGRSKMGRAQLIAAVKPLV
jgi:hypothetical protein